MQIRQLTAEDEALFPAALEILNRLQGRDIFPPQYLDERSRDPASYILGAFHEGQIIGVAVALVLSRFDSYTSFGPENIADFQTYRTGTLLTMAVDENFQGQGVGQKMSQARLVWLKEQGCRIVIGISWVSGLKHTSDRVFQKLGFKEVARQQDFYEQISRERQFICPACGGPPCQCGAILYRLDL